MAFLRNGDPSRDCHFCQGRIQFGKVPVHKGVSIDWLACPFEATRCNGITFCISIQRASIIDDQRSFGFQRAIMNKSSSQSSARDSSW